MSATTEEFFRKAAVQLHESAAAFGPIPCTRAGFAILLEQTDYLWDGIKRGHDNLGHDMLQADALVRIAEIAARMYEQFYAQKDGGPTP